MDEKDRLLTRRADLAALDNELRWANAVRDTKLASTAARQPFLVQGIGEDPADFTKRAELCEYAPLVPLIAERIEGTVWKHPPSVKAPGLEAFLDEAAPDGRDAHELVRDACADALWGRFAVILVDRPRLPDGAQPLTAADDAAMRLAVPYGVVYTSSQVLDYRLDRLGNLESIRLDGPAYMEGTTSVREVREIDKNGIQVWHITKPEKGIETAAKAGEIVPLAEALVAEGRLPVVPVRYKRVDAVQGRSPFSAALLAEKGAFRLLSDITWDLWLAGHPTMLVKTLAETLGQVGVGTSKYLKLKPKAGEDEGDSVTYLEAELPGLEKQFARYAEARQEVQQQAGVRPIATVDKAVPSSPESGVAQSIRVDAESYVLGNVADMAADVEWELLTVVALDMGKPADAIEVTYSKDFSLQSAVQQLATAQSFRSLLGPESTATKEAIRRAVMAHLDNLSPEQQAKIAAEIEADGAYVPPAPDLMGGGSPFPNSKRERAVPAGPGGKSDQGKPKE